MTDTIPGLAISFLEGLLVLSAVGLALARWCPPRARRPVTAAAATLVALSGTAVVASGVRWQLVPVLVAAAIAFAIAAPTLWRRRTGPPPRRAPRWLALPGSAALLGLVAIGPAAAWALPVPVFPEPSGPFRVGTTVRQWTDPGRPELASAEPDDRRTIVVQLWYPARESPAGVPRSRYLGRTEEEARAVADALAAYVDAPGFLLHGARCARTHAVPDAAVADGGGRFPVVLFSPGLGGVRTQNTAWAEELASQGYVVAALDHPYDSAAVVLAGGRTVHTHVAATGDPDEDERLVAGWTAVRAADLSFTLTQLGRLDRGEIAGPLAGRLDTRRAAATGHSVGGAAALRAARQDHRFTAVINLD
ncbi:MAG TPA: hypothetical protein VNV66_21080, partial [Pilimelia sp.]|nr:hypothetical protein [Pilimelia sp.]